MLSPAWLNGDGEHTISVVIPVNGRKRDTLSFDAAMHALMLTFPQAAEEAKSRRPDLESAAPELWKQLPAWVHGDPPDP
jgi:hypothetical protein